MPPWKRRRASLAVSRLRRHQPSLQVQNSRAVVRAPTGHGLSHSRPHAGRRVCDPRIAGYCVWRNRPLKGAALGPALIRHERAGRDDPLLQAGPMTREMNAVLLHLLTTGYGRYCCKSPFALAIKNFPGLWASFHFQESILSAAHAALFSVFAEGRRSSQPSMATALYASTREVNRGRESA